MDLAGAISQRPGRQDVTGTSVFTNMLNRHFYDLIRDIFLAVLVPANKVLSLNSYTS